MHRLKDVWLPAFRRGEATFEDPKHLATVLNEIGGEGEIEHLQRLVENKQLDQKNLPAAISAILAVSDKDAFRRFGLNPEPYTQSDNYDSESHAAVLGELVKIVGTQERPRQLGKQQLAGIEKDLRVLIRRTKANVGTINDRLADQIHVSALELAGLWQLPGLRSEILDTANDQTTSVSVRSAALLALGHYRLPDDEETLTRFATQTRPAKLRVAAIDSLTKLDLEAAATSAAGYFSDVTTNNDTDVADDVAVLTAFLQKRDGATRLASAFQNLDSSTASRVLRSLFASGRSDAELVQALIKSIGATAQPPTYSKQLVNQLSAQAVSLGDDNRGYAVFRSLACHSCHQVAGSGGKIGPDLTTLGTTLSSERIVEEVLWPSRQIKEGYASVTVLTSDGRVHTGFERTSQREIDSGDVVIEDVTSNTRTTIKAKNIEEKKVGLSAMPEGLTSFLSDQQLADLIKYLSNLGKLK
jgi:putative heme-binding domain-containing protein